MRTRARSRPRLSGLLPTRQDWRDSWGAIARGTAIGFFVGVLPGAGATIASFLAYATEKRVSRRPEKFGTGVIEGVAAPESANNAASTGALVPLMALGIPGSGTTAVMLGALTLYGLQPGPLLMSTNPEVFWGLVASMYVGNVMLLILNLPLAPAFASILRIPYSVLVPIIIGIALFGVYSVENSIFNVGVALLFGGIGFCHAHLRLSAGAAGAGAGARAHAGEGAAPVDADVARQPGHLLHAAGERRNPGLRAGGRAVPGHRVALVAAPWEGAGGRKLIGPFRAVRG